VQDKDSQKQQKKLLQFKVTIFKGVALCRTQSGKNCEAENFRLMTTIIPDMIGDPVHIIPPAEWCNGMGR